ncbi:MAG: Gfo/Idh/MocA family oxidoreductase [Oscillospiraceae bacterium]|jgi:predicted dehydrogenase|nr:Gfo/Idh/MocA family oxidoreductase [Oscillospiraceae bacterium]
MSDKIKVGIIGCGAISDDKHLRAIKSIPEAEIAAFCDIIPEKAEKMRAKYATNDAKIYVDYKDLLKDDSIGAIHVCTPNSSHAPISVASLKAGKHVMCEKPMATTYADAKLMCDTAVENGKLLTIGYQYRCRPDPLFLKQLCEDGELGEIYFAKAHAIRRRGVPTWGVFLKAEEQGGGPLIDIGTHALDMTLWMMDNYKPKTVMGTVYKKLSDHPNCGNIFGPWDPKEYTVEDSAFGFVVMENGATIILESSWALNYAEEGEAMCTLCGTKAGVSMQGGLRVISDKYNKFTEMKPDFSEGFIAYVPGGKVDKPEEIECRNFYDAILYGKELRVKAEQALVVTQILEAIYESGKTGKPVMF